MATIKEQTEKTEQLKTTLDNKVIAIAEEIKKQDDINITRLSEVPDAIAQLKNSRKRWATGSGLQFGSAGSTYPLKYMSIDLSKCDFDPSVVVLIFSYKPNYGDTLKWVLGVLANGVRTFYNKSSHANDITSGPQVVYRPDDILGNNKYNHSKSNFVIINNYGPGYLYGEELKKLDAEWYAFE